MLVWRTSSWIDTESDSLLDRKRKKREEGSEKSRGATGQPKNLQVTQCVSVTEYKINPAEESTYEKKRERWGREEKTEKVGREHDGRAMCYIHRFEEAF